MDKIIAMESLLLYKEAAKILREHNIEFDKAKLLSDPEFCRELIRIVDYYNGDGWPIKTE